MSSEPTPEEALLILKKIREKQKEATKKYQASEKGKEKQREKALNYYHTHKEEINQKKREKRANEKAIKQQHIQLEIIN